MSFHYLLVLNNILLPGCITSLFIHSPLEGHLGCFQSEAIRVKLGFPAGSECKESACNAVDLRDSGLIPGSGRSPGRGHGNPFLVFLPGEHHGRRSLVRLQAIEFHRVRHN